MLRTINIFSLPLFLVMAYTQATDVKSLEYFLNNTQTLEADFTQILIDPNGQELERLQGIFIAKRPNKFYWNYKHPYDQVIVIDDQLLWLYEQDIEQAIINDIDSAKEIAAITILGNYMDIERQFIIIDKGGGQGINWVELTPRDIESRHKIIRLGFAEDKLTRILMLDDFGQIIRIDFTNITVNQKIDNDIFNFTPPLGTEIIDNRS